jgi:hypothetical protein
MQNATRRDDDFGSSKLKLQLVAGVGVEPTSEAYGAPREKPFPNPPAIKVKIVYENLMLCVNFQIAKLPDL